MSAVHMPKVRSGGIRTAAVKRTQDYKDELALLIKELITCHT